MEEKKMCECCTCGYRWQWGLSGDHECTHHLIKERDALRAEVARLSKPMMVRVTMGEDEKIASIGGVTLEDVTVTEYPATETEWPRFEVSGVVREGGEG